MFPPFVFGLIAFAVCVCTLPLAKRAAEYWNIYDHPGALKIHSRPVPRVGGVAMMVGVCACLVPAALVAPDRYGLILLAFSAVWVVGLTDDVRDLSPLFRLGVHLAAGALLWIGGWRLHWTSHAVLDLLLTCLFVAFLINAMNLFDGLDGLAAGTTAMAAMGFVWLLPSSAELIPKIVAWSLLGVCLGVLLENFPPAKVFMGDSGSTLLGILLAFLSLEWVRIQPDSHNIQTSLILISLPVADALFAVVRRLRTWKSPLCGDRRHLYDLLVQRGWSARGVLLASMATTGVLVVMGWLSQTGQRASQVVVVVIFVFLWVAAHVLGSLRTDVKHSQADPQMTPASVNPIGE